MPSLDTQKEIRKAQGLQFCYVCGAGLPTLKCGGRNFDHVPPETCFAQEDRCPLKLPTHSSCNSDRKMRDEKMGQLFLGKNNRDPGVENLRLKGIPAAHADPSSTLAILQNVEIQVEVWHWIRGFHAALYDEYLDPRENVALETPWPLAIQGPSGFLIPQPLKEQHLAFVQTIKVNRYANNLDRIRCNNGKLRYECVWDVLSDRRWACVFALDIYGWRDLGDIGLETRGCAGLYSFKDGHLPKGATKATALEVVLPPSDPLDPFAS